MQQYDVRTYEVRTSIGQRLRSIAGGLVVPAVLLGGCGAWAYLGSKDSSDRVSSLTGIGLIIAFVAVFTIVTHGRSQVLLSVAQPGIRLAGVTLPWQSIARVVVGSGTDVGVRLMPGAPLPDGIAGIVHDPHRPETVHLFHRFPGGRVDPERLVAAVRAWAPPEVDVAVRPAVEPEQRPNGGRQRRDGWAVVTGVRWRSGRVHVYRRSTTSEHVRAKPHLVVNFALPDGREVVAETSNPGQGQPGTWVQISHDVDDPIDVRVDSGVPRSRWVRTW